MKKYAIGVIVGLTLFAHPVSAGELFNVGLRVDLKYHSFGESCRLHALFKHYNLYAELTDGRVTRAQLQKINIHGPSTTHNVSENEAQLLDIRTDQNLSWVKSMFISHELLQLIHQTGNGLAKDACTPPKDLVLDVPGDLEFDFQVEEVGYLLPHFINSKPVIVKGHKTNGDPIRIELTLTQDRT